ncbi:putative WRKY transcription factor [Tripterygium wilfordii]|uniref:Putative WRKY transcription factor n=1 Tax=Tripterygium wilfordii TaxID=458696 RepID=A0A7J7CTH7_TRIWF|nr:probable WRKY transcription factor 70 [Tripterygium wilfordii]KAF5737298.1 putative WRKY transcription factor [Tripterygium wilfordii]
MEISCPENTPAGQRKAIEELRRGFELAKELQILISKSSSGDNETSMCASSGDLLERISNSFSCAISVLNNVEFSEVNQSPASMPGPKSEDSEGSSKTTAAVKNRRGCYKRRKTEEDTWSTETVNWEDGHAWRKYGQKVILNHKYPRNYYRCTHKSDGCPATKQVQQIRDDPPMHRTTYHGNHTCQDFLKKSQTTLFEDHDSSAAVDSSVLFLSFDGGSNLTNKQPDYNKKLQDNPLFSSSSSSLSIKQEHNIDNYHHHVVQCGLTPNQSSSSDYLFPPDELTAFGSSLSCDHADVISWTASNHHNFNDMGSIDHFEDVLKHYGFESL